MIKMPKQFGMFIHWGPYAITGWHEQVRMRRGISRAEYAAMASGFHPKQYDPESWVLLAKEAGMEYICFTTKHHDGFCMWDTKETDFNICRTAGRDVLAELADACRKYDMALSLYYSIPDWNHPCAYNPLSSHQCPPEEGDTPDSEAYRSYVRAQVRELLTGYGPIYTWFWDIPPRIYDPSMNEYVRSLQSEIRINDRGWSEGDFSTPERTVPEGGTFTRYTEACQSVGKESWGYRIDEDYFTPAFLANSMDRIFCMGGSFLLNAGPDADGVIPSAAEACIRACGRWYQAVREAYEDVTPLAEWTNDDVAAFRRCRTVYLHTLRPLLSTGLAIPSCTTLPQNVTLLNTGKPVECCIETYPEDFTGYFGENKPSILRLRRIPAADDHMPLVFRLDF